jgi:uncharacterized protein DUF1553/uncharacterized protein DUF1549/concanavalin A-like lectin/glucanase superfamily protein/cytochrome c
METMSYKIVAGLVLVIRIALPVCGAPAETSSTDIIGFNRSIRPLLSDRCFACHGPDSVQRKAGIRFDRPDSLFGPLPKDPDKRAFVAGKPQESEAYLRITSSDSDEVMPPAKSHLKLNAQEKETIREWIEQGAHWEQFWAFIPPVRPALPEVKDTSWPKNDIDRFILARLESEGMHPSPEADKPALIRRVSLALTGLPPTLAEVDAFVADNSPDAYEKVVDRLLASPRYGEEMASRWLDYARYADSHGYQSDPERHMWRWRDWVINAFNKNMPFDEFTIEQLAGDLLPNATIDQRIATGFNRNHRINDEGGIIAEEWRVEGVIDRAETTGAVWLGLTVGCCRCHDHKFDPITQKDFYSFCGFFNNVNEEGVGPTGPTDKGINVPPVLKLATPEQTKTLDELAAKLNASKAHLAELEKGAPQLMAAWEQDQQHRASPAGLVASFRLDGDVRGTAADGKAIGAEFHDGSGATTQPSFDQGISGQKAIKFDGKGAALDAGQAVDFESTDAFSYGARVNIHRQETASILSKMDDTAGFRGFDLFLDNGKLTVHIIHKWSEDAIKVVSDAPIPKDKWVSLLATYDGTKKAAGVKLYLDGALQPVHFEQDHLTATIKTPVPLLIGKRPTSSPFTGKVADVVFFNRVLTPQEAAEVAFGPEVRSILAIAPEQRSAAQKKQLEDDFHAGSPEIAQAKGEIASTTASIDEVNKQVADTMVMEDQPAKRENFVLIRGQYDKHGEVVPTGVPAVFGQLAADQPSNRLGLARWIMDPANPLTGRVLANRLWEKYFGTGLVKTSENMGTQSEPPSHPELLDWLATELVRDNWDLKKFQKLIVMSAAYRQSSATSPELIERDPENRLIAHGPRFRLSAEEIRDQVLAASGLLVEKVGGPSVRPYEPANLWSGNLYGNLSQYVPDKGEALYRRSIYSFLKRTATPPNLTEFDMPSREYCVIKRSRTDTPLQALDLMDDPTYVEASRVLGEHMMTDGGSTPEDRISYCFRRLTARAPTSTESQILLDGFEKQLAHYRSDPGAAAQFVSVGDNHRDPRLDASELAAYTMTASVILNLDETINLP